LARLESRIAFEEFRARYPRYRVDERGLRRVHMANGWVLTRAGRGRRPRPSRRRAAVGAVANVR
jgi:hypothetical protein